MGRFCENHDNHNSLYTYVLKSYNTRIGTCALPDIIIMYNIANALSRENCSTLKFTI